MAATFFRSNTKRLCGDEVIRVLSCWGSNSNLETSVFFIFFPSFSTDVSLRDVWFTLGGGLALWLCSAAVKDALDLLGGVATLLELVNRQTA